MGLSHRKSSLGQLTHLPVFTKACSSKNNDDDDDEWLILITLWVLGGQSEESEVKATNLIRHWREVHFK